MPVISGKALGRKKPLFADFSIPLPPELPQDGGGLTLRQLISRVVRDEVSAFRKRQSDRQLFKALTAQEIAAQAEKGKVEMGATEVGLQEVDEESAIGAALQAFEDGLYFVVIDEHQHKSLDAEVFLQPDSRITFLRLTLLAGG